MRKQLGLMNIDTILPSVVPVKYKLPEHSTPQFQNRFSYISYFPSVDSTKYVNIRNFLPDNCLYKKASNSIVYSNRDDNHLSKEVIAHCQLSTQTVKISDTSLF